MAPVDPLRRQFLRRAFFGMGLLGAGRILPACGRELDTPQTPGAGLAGVRSTTVAPAYEGRDPLRYASGVSDDGGPGEVTIVTPDEVLEGSGRYDPPTVANDDFDTFVDEDDAGAPDPDEPPPDKPTPTVVRPIDLLPADELGIQLPDGFAARIVARTGEPPTALSDYLWHGAPDGGATFALSDGGHIYVSNSELSDVGGVGALRFDAAATIVDAYPILAGTTRNCAGGATPWGTWISCEEVARGLCWECDPLGVEPGVARPALGTFTHEAVAVDMARRQVYLTEDLNDGCLYRFTSERVLPGGALDLTAGTLEVMQVLNGANGPVAWHPVPDPSAAVTATRYQVAESTPFAGGEGIWFHEGIVFFTTKWNNRVYALDVDAAELTLIYNARWYDPATLTGVDNITMSPSGDLLVAEDEGNMELALLDVTGKPHAFLRMLDQSGSELAGPAFDASGTRLYVSSQRGLGSGNGGITYEIRGPFSGLLK